ncbi:cupin domain [Nonomuraea polychroma]|uniref:Cupin domain n=1 Tax=Nonomuraea polychroma TaxID=46176 RepID=A0A438M4Q7_9ACTN|nr:cupin domain-containing protein [Nonomuraea polychroma]RVX40732.1 cupin domain [Nonomuraea polychroma]
MSLTSPHTWDAVVVPEGSAEVVELSQGGAFRLLVDASATSRAFSANRLTLSLGVDGAKPHYHALSSELFYVLAGTTEFLLGERIVTAGRGSLVAVPPKVVHAFGAAPDSTADLLVIMAPGVERFEYFRRLGRISHGQDSFDSLLPEQDRFDVHFADSTAWPRARAR